MPPARIDLQSRNVIFQRLKPRCVDLSQKALAFQSSRGNITSLAKSLESLLVGLHDVIKQYNALDEKLADYVFFPLSQVLKASQKLTTQCLELSLQCLSILLQHGWRKQIQPQLAIQILILCTLLAEKEPKNLGITESTDDLQRNALACLHFLFSGLGSSIQARDILTGDAKIPQLGQSISVQLDAIEIGRSTDTQKEAAVALHALCVCVEDSNVLAAFLPGIVSSFTKILTPQTKARRNHAVVNLCLKILLKLVGQFLNNEAFETAKSIEGGEEGISALSPLNIDWFKNASTQMRPALASILRLQSHNRNEVREHLSRLCFMLLRDCSVSLENCLDLVMSTFLSLLASDGVDQDTKLSFEIALTSDESLSSLMQETIYDHLQALPRILQGADEDNKERVLKKIGAAYSFLETTVGQTTVLQEALSKALQDGAFIALHDSKQKGHNAPSIEPIQSLSLTLRGSSSEVTEYKPLLIGSRGQEATFKDLETLIVKIASSRMSSNFMSDLMRSLQQSEGDGRVANFWVTYTALQAKLQQTDIVNEFMDFGASKSTDSSLDDLEELYALSLSILTAHSDESVDPRLQSLALRTVALRARSAGEEFRYELIDALYPTLHALATPNEQLQHDSVVTLNILSKACNYDDVRQLIVENVDYLTNAVALKLNAFDVSPQAPQVLLMMMRLAGPSLVPYLEDTVDSIFAVLEDYHGYALLVELLFKVLSVLAEEGAKAPQLSMIEDNMASLRASQHGLDNIEQMSMHGLADLLRERQASKDFTLPQAERKRPTPHQKRPWSEIQTLDSDDEHEEPDPEKADDAAKPPDDEPPPPPVPKTYNLLLKIADLTQHYLPSASPSLRTSLLSLIRTVIPALSKHESSLLPLINTLWPEIVTRLDDHETHVQAAALEIISVLCEYAGDFMRSRIHQLWPAIMDNYRQIVKDLVGSQNTQGSSNQQLARSKQEKEGRALVPAGISLRKLMASVRAQPGDYSNTASRAKWEAMIDLLVKIVGHVPLLPQMIDEALEMLGPVIDERDDVRSVLERENADAVWLYLFRRGLEKLESSQSPRPNREGEAKWKFVDVVA